MSPELQAIFSRFGTQIAVARAFGVTPAAVIKWVRSGRLPPLRRFQWRDMQRGLGQRAKGRRAAQSAS